MDLGQRASPPPSRRRDTSVITGTGKLLWILDPRLVLAPPIFVCCAHALTMSFLVLLYLLQLNFLSIAMHNYPKMLHKPPGCAAGAGL